MTALPDVNVLVALAWPNHVHHAPAQRWFATLGDREWATTPFTEAGFARVSSNATVLPTAVSPAAALGMLDRMRGAGHHRFLPDDVEGVLGAEVERARVLTARQVTDAHLLAVARRHQASLTTFDRGLAGLGGGDVSLLDPG